MSLAPGTLLGPYEILELLGAGGMGEVWKARDTRLGRMVAIKRLKVQYSARFEQEARAIAALNHPHICTLHDIGSDYLVMEYVQGQMLSGPLTLEQTSRIALQIADALEAAHKQGILHRDLKPANVMVTEAGAKLLDFGLAKLTTDSAADATATMDSTISGTAAYMSPEQALGKALDARSDIFSFGAVLYELLSGRRAFDGGSILDTLNAVVLNEPASFDSPLFSVVKRCLSKTPAQRFQNMAELKNALQTALAPASKPSNQQPSIAVLPFANLSRDADDEYFSDGLAEEIINALMKVTGLKVIARTSAFAFKGQNIDIRKIAEVLGVSTVLEGSVRKAGNRIRVTAQLITAADGTHLWSERYDRELADIFEVQDEIASAIAGSLKVKLSTNRAARYTPKLPAYQAYLKARHNRGRLTRESIALYQDYLEQTIALDPNFALAYVDMADSYLMLSTTVGPAHKMMQQVRTYARKALDLDPALPEAQAMMGIVSCIYDYDWSEGARRFDLAMEQEPIAPQVREWYGFFCWVINTPDQAAEQMIRGLEEDPLNILSRQSLVSCLWGAGRLDDAAHELSECIKLDPQLPFAYSLLAIVEVSRGSLIAAESAAEKSLAMVRWPITVGVLAGISLKLGKTARAQELLRELGDGSDYGAPLGMAYSHLMSNDLSAAADWVQKAIEQRVSLLWPYLLSPLTEPLRSSSHWPRLMKMMNMPVFEISSERAP
jgi:TolB-like protein/tRNA A-37 threonylcarbamoyl transferase component Bud32/Tfp pilus assembly protein PilF